MPAFIHYILLFVAITLVFIGLFGAAVLVWLAGFCEWLFRPFQGFAKQPFRPAMLALCLCAIALPACNYLKDYSRSYSISATDRFGQSVAISATLTPPQAQYAVKQLEAQNVIASNSARLTEVEPEPLAPAATQLATLTKPASREAFTYPREAFTYPSERPVWRTPALDAPMTYLTRKEGKVWALQLASGEDRRNELKAAGWHEVPMPMYDPDHDFAPQWDNKRGKWRVKRVENVASR